MMMNVVGLRFSLLSFVPPLLHYVVCLTGYVQAYVAAHMAKNMLVLPLTPIKYKKIINAV